MMWQLWSLHGNSVFCSPRVQYGPYYAMEKNIPQRVRTLRELYPQPADTITTWIYIELHNL